MTRKTKKTIKNKFNSYMNQSFSLDRFLLKYQIIHYIPSNAIRQYLEQNLNKLTLLQYATLLVEYYQGDIVAEFNLLSKITCDEYEKTLFSLAAKDYQVYQTISDETIKYYNECDPRNAKPEYPFTEWIDLPVMFQQYDIVKYENRLVVIDDIPKHIFLEQDFTDNCYLAYELKIDGTINDETLFNLHCHPHICEVEKIELTLLSNEEKNQYDKLVTYLTTLKEGEEK